MSKKELMSIVHMSPVDAFLEIVDDMEKFKETALQNNKSHEDTILLIVILGKLHEVPFDQLKDIVFMIFGSNVVFRDDILAYVRYAVDLEEKGKQNLLPFADQVWSSLEVFCKYAKNIEGSANCWAFFTRALCKVLEGKSRDSLVEKYSMFSSLKDELEVNFTYKDNIYVCLDDLKKEQFTYYPQTEGGKFKDAKEYLNFLISYLKSYFLVDLYHGLQEYKKLEEDKRCIDNFKDIGGTRMFPVVRIHKDYPPFTLLQDKYFLLDFAPRSRNNGKLREDRKAEVIDGIECIRNATPLFLSTSPNFENITMAWVVYLTEELKQEGFLIVDILWMENVKECILDRDLFLVVIPDVFEPKIHTLRTLKRMSTALLPMKKYLVSCESSAILPHIPDYDSLKKDSQIKKMGLNQKQIEAIEMALTREVSLIDGPPGSGKTRITLNIIKDILENSSSQILIVAYKNFVLDKIILKSSKLTDKVARIGWYYKDANVEKHTLNDDIFDPRYCRLRKHTNSKCIAAMNKFIDTMQSLEGSEEVSNLEEDFQNLIEAKNQFLKIRSLNMYYNCKDARIIGVTTTGVSKYHELLDLLRPSVVIFYDAHNIPEPHIVTSLTEHTEQMIFIGDHKRLGQLQYHHFFCYCPKIMFIERLLENNLNTVRLNVQYRMHSEIADLVRGTIYDDLKDGDNVQNYEPIKGIPKNLFCVTLKNSSSLDHLIKEYPVEEYPELTEEVFHQTLFSLCLANYLRQQGYQAHEIVILALYSKLESAVIDSMKKYFPLLHYVEVQVIDHFQGEECRIAIVSLAKVDKETDYDFLAAEYRLCILMTRAQEGLYIVGDLEPFIEKNETWGKVKEKLEAKESIGPGLPVKCEKHGCEILVHSAEDFIKISKNGCPTGELNKEDPCYETI
uniref:DNA2/NAM7 helicase-like C-terminal domain-containing protein n=1 Tax=Phlebotomus papatasi TaxID=29031 RepID=A0A1B0D786_PHLPP